MNAMKQTTGNIVLALSLMGFGGIVSAHDQSGSLGKSAKAVDYYQVQCFDAGDGTGNTEYLELSVIDTDAIKSNSIISVQVIKGLLAYSSTDNGPDGDINPSPVIQIYGGNGAYQVLVDKSRAPADDYSLDFHCKSKSDHTGTSIVQLQNK